MPFASGTADVGADAVPLCPVSGTGVKVRNNGGTLVFLGGAAVGHDGDEQGYPLEPGASEAFTGAQHRSNGVVPAPPGDGADDVLYARTAPGTGIARVSWIGSS